MYIVVKKQLYKNLEELNQQKPNLEHENHKALNQNKLNLEHEKQSIKPT